MTIPKMTPNPLVFQLPQLPATPTPEECKRWIETFQREFSKFMQDLNNKLRPLL